MSSLFAARRKKSEKWVSLTFNLLIILSLTLMTFGTTGTTAALAGDKTELKADPRLLQMATNYPESLFKVIVQRDAKNKDAKVDDPQSVVQKGGGKSASSWA